MDEYNSGIDDETGDFQPNTMEFFEQNYVWGSYLRRYLERNPNHLEQMSSSSNPIELPAIEVNISENSENVKIIPVLIPVPQVIPQVQQVQQNDDDLSLRSLMKDNDDEITIRISRKKQNAKSGKSGKFFSLFSIAMGFIGIGIGFLISENLPKLR